MYITTVPKWYRMLRDPQMTLQFYITNFLKFAVDKVTKRNVFLDAAKRSEDLLFPMRSSIRCSKSGWYPKSRSFVADMEIASLQHVFMHCYEKREYLMI